MLQFLEVMLLHFALLQWLKHGIRQDIIRQNDRGNVSQDKINLASYLASCYCPFCYLKYLSKYYGLAGRTNPCRD